MDHVKPKRIALRRSAFRAWLSSHSLDIVGYACEENDCPLTQWLQDVYAIWFIVGSETYSFSRGSLRVSRQLPAWAKVFVRTLDFTYPFYNEVKGVEALSLLNEVEQVLTSGSPEVWLPSWDDVPLCNVPAREHADREGCNDGRM